MASHPPDRNGIAPAREDRAEAIAEAALEVFLDKGFAAARLDDVAARAGVAKGTIYLYFESKEVLFEAAVTSRLGPFLDQAEALVDGWDGPAKDLLRAAAGHFATLVESDTAPRLIRLILAEAHGFPGVAERYYHAVIARAMGILRRTIAYGVERGEWRETKLEEFPQIIAAPMVLSAVWKVTFSDFAPMDLRSFIDTYFDLILHGLSKEAA